MPLLPFESNRGHAHIPRSLDNTFHKCTSRKESWRETARNPLPNPYIQVIEVYRQNQQGRPWYQPYVEDLRILNSCTQLRCPSLKASKKDRPDASQWINVDREKCGRDYRTKMIQLALRLLC